MHPKHASNDDHNALGQRLKLEMKKRGMSSVELAAKADVKTSFLYDVISGKSANPSTIKLGRVAESLGVSLAYLAGTSDLPNEGYQFAITQSNSEALILPGIYADPEHPARVVEKISRREEHLQFQEEWLKLSFGADPKSLRLFIIRGDGMAPTLRESDVVMINNKQTHPSPAGLFLVSDGMSLTVKRLEYLPQASEPSVKVMSDNHLYSPYDIPLDKLNIIGRVVWISRIV